MKIVINTCFGGFSLSKEALSKLGGNPSDWRHKRSDPDLVKTIEDLGPKANGPFAELKIVEIPDGVNWTIDDYDGIETIHEVHRTWS